MQTVGTLAVVAALVWGVLQLGKQGKKGTSLVALVLAFVAGLMLRNTMVPVWIGSIPGPIVGYACGTLLILAIFAGAIDLVWGHKSDWIAIAAAVALPLLWDLGRATAQSTMTQLLAAG